MQRYAQVEALLVSGHNWRKIKHSHWKIDDMASPLSQAGYNRVLCHQGSIIIDAWDSPAIEGEEIMSIEILEKLEAKVQMAVDTISLLQMEIEELKDKNVQLEQESNVLREGRGKLEEENSQLREDHQQWQARIRALLGKMDDVE